MKTGVYSQYRSSLNAFNKLIDMTVMGEEDSTHSFLNKPGHHYNLKKISYINNFFEIKLKEITPGSKKSKNFISNICLTHC